MFTVHELPQLLSGNVSLLHSWSIVLPENSWWLAPSSFRILNMLSYLPLLASNISIMRNQLLILLRIPCYDKLLLFCCFHNSVFGFQQFDCIMSQCGSLSFSCLEFTKLRCIYFMFSDLEFFHLFFFFPSNSFSAPFFFLLLGLLDSYIGTYDDLPPVYWALFIFLFLSLNHFNGL